MSNYGNDWRDTGFGEGQERYYGDLSPQQPPPPVEPSHGDSGRGGDSGHRSTGPLIAVAGVLAIVLAAGGIYVATRGSGADADRQAQGASAPASPTTPTPSARTATRSAAPTPEQKPLAAGWQVASGNNDFPVVFDVPPASETFKAAVGGTRPEWEINTKSTARYGFADPRTGFPLAMTDYTATYRAGNCSTSPSNALAFVGFTKTSGDAPTAASGMSDKFLKAMSLKENGTDRVKYTEGKAKTVKVNGGKTSAVQIRTDVPWSRSDNSFCSRHERELVVTSVPTGNGTATIVASRVKDPSHGLDEKTFDKILKSIRPRV